MPQTYPRIRQKQPGDEMKALAELLGKDLIRFKLSLLWLFAMLNYIYADILSLMDPSVLRDILSGSVGISPMTLLAGAILMEIPIAMVFLCLVLTDKVNRWANIGSGVIKTLAVLGSLSVGTPSLYYVFFVVIEVTATVTIVVMAWRWRPQSVG
jgi:hypothetical protein